MTQNLWRLYPATVWNLLLSIVEVEGIDMLEIYRMSALFQIVNLYILTSGLDFIINDLRTPLLTL